MSREADPTVLVAIVGPCSAGKSTLVPSIKDAGYGARQPAQEHSFVPDMWWRITRPDILIYLDVSYQAARLRRPHIDGGPERLANQHVRLDHARNHCDYYLDTSDLTPLEVRQEVLAFIYSWQKEHQ